MARPSPTTGSLLALTLLVAQGCYSYVAVSPDGVAPGQDVRARLRSEAGEELRSLLGRDDSALEGEVIQREDGGLLLHVPTATRRVGFHSQTLKQRILVPETSVLELERRELDRRRTTLLVAALGAGLGALAWNALGGDAGGNTSSPPGDDGAQTRVPQLGVTLPLPWPRD